MGQAEQSRPSESLSQAAYARRNGVSRQYINKLIKFGVLRTQDDGSLLVATADELLSQRQRRVGAAPRRSPRRITQAWLPAVAVHCYQSKEADRALRRKYRVGISGKDALICKQNGRCAICHRQFDSADPKSIHLDHRHMDGLVRGVLCNKCNVMIGLAGEDIQVLRDAIAYLENGGPPPWAN